MRKIWMAIAIALMIPVLVSANGKQEERESGGPVTEVTLASFGPQTNFGSASIAISNAVKETSGIRTNVTPAGNDTTRIMQVREKEAEFTVFAVSTAWMASHGTGQFAAEGWGPMKLRVAWRGGTYDTGFFTRANSGIESVKDLKGKTISMLTGGLAQNQLMMGLVASAGYTMDDVETLYSSSYSQAFKAVTEGAADAFVGTPSSSLSIELAATKAGIKWFDLNKCDDEGWRNFLNFAPWSVRDIPQKYAGKDHGHPEFGALGYNFGFWTWDDQDEEVVYQYAKAIWDSYDKYQDKHPLLDRWTHEMAANTAEQHWPFHDGYIRLLKEKGLWTEEHEAFQQRQLENERKRIELWESALKEAKDKGIKIGSEEFQHWWWWEKLEANGLLQ